MDLTDFEQSKVGKLYEIIGTKTMDRELTCSTGWRVQISWFFFIAFFAFAMHQDASKPPSQIEYPKKNMVTLW